MILLQLCGLVAPDNMEGSKRENPNKNVASKVSYHGRKRLGVGVCGVNIPFLGIAPLCLPNGGAFQELGLECGQGGSEKFGLCPPHPFQHFNG